MLSWFEISSLRRIVVWMPPHQRTDITAPAERGRKCVWAYERQQNESQCEDDVKLAHPINTPATGRPQGWALISSMAGKLIRLKQTLCESVATHVKHAVVWLVHEHAWLTCDWLTKCWLITLLTSRRQTASTPGWLRHRPEILWLYRAAIANTLTHRCLLPYPANTQHHNRPLSHVCIHLMKLRQQLQIFKFMINANMPLSINHEEINIFM